jgi:DNA-binding Lrp family transcriptional regulator
MLGGKVMYSSRNISKKGDQSHEISLDDLDFRIISLLVTGSDNKHISDELKVPLSTIQRRTRNILLSGIVTMRIEPNFRRLGIKKGLLHVYLSTGDIKECTLKVAKMEGMLSASVHVGNSDIVGEFVYEDSEQLVDTISNIKHLDGVDRVMWSEEVYAVPVEAENVLSAFKKMWEKSGKYSEKSNNNNLKYETNNGFKKSNHRNNSKRVRSSRKRYY